MKCRGSITIFLSLSLTMILSLLFTLLESARLYGLQSHATMESQVMLESQMAQYHQKMYEQYGIYLLEANRNGELSLEGVDANMQALGMENLCSAGDGQGGSTLNLYALNLTECHVVQKELVTDDKGAAFVMQAAACMKSGLLLSPVENLYENAEELQQLEETTGDVDDLFTQADTALGDLEAANEVALETNSGGETEEMPLVPLEEDFENPIEYVKELKNNAVLTQVIEDVSKVSDQKIQEQGDLLHRTLYEGNYPTESPGFTDKLLFKEYLLKQFADYTSPGDQGVLQYELEYIICGENSDKENLTEIVEELLALRELANYIFIHQDEEKVSLAYSMAVAIGGISLNPAVIKVIQEGILAAWAYTEAVEDVKTLLKGGKVSLLKTDSEWGTNLQKVSQSVYGENPESESGMDYQAYLRLLLYGASEKKLAMRTLNLMEHWVRSTPGNQAFRMDCMVTAMTVSWVYEGKPLFFGLYGSGAGWNRNYQFMRVKKFSYQ
ncbi:MAG: DUF5702 domain-containing protein [Roseburia sp.]